MDRPILSVMQKHVTTVDYNASIDSVEKTLNEYKLSCVPVVDSEGNCFGVISAPDLVHFHMMRKNSRAERAWEVCTHKVIEVNPDTSIKEVAELMIKNKIHHIVVIENGSIRGIVSSIDLVEEYLVKRHT